MNNREGESNMKQKIRIKVCVDPNIYSVLETKTVLVICHLRAASKYYYYFALMKTCKVIGAERVLVQMIAQNVTLYIQT